MPTFITSSIWVRHKTISHLLLQYSPHLQTKSASLSARASLCGGGRHLKTYLTMDVGFIVCDAFMICLPLSFTLFLLLLYSYFYTLFLFCILLYLCCSQTLHNKYERQEDSTLRMQPPTPSPPFVKTKTYLASEKWHLGGPSRRISHIRQVEMSVW